MMRNIFNYMFFSACESCSKGLDFGECVYSGDVSDSNLEEHLNLIQSGYCQCQDVDTAEKTKVPLKIMFIIL